MELLKTFYEEVTTLKLWLEKIQLICPQTESAHETLRTKPDSSRFQTFLDTTLVASSQKIKPLKVHISAIQQVSHQKELLLRVIAKLVRKDGGTKNLLTYGFRPMSEDPDAYICSIPGLEYKYPNSSFSRLHFPVWKTLLSRIGDTLMEYLLENMSLFTLVSPSVCVQLTGIPAYEVCPSPLSSPACGQYTNQTVRRNLKRNLKEDVQELHIVKKMKLVNECEGQDSTKTKTEPLATQLTLSCKQQNIHPDDSFKPYSHNLVIHVQGYYKKTMVEKFPKNYILKNGSTAEIYENVATYNVYDSPVTNFPSVPYIPELKKFLCKIAKNHKRFPYKAIADFYCPRFKRKRIGSARKRKKSSVTISEILSNNTPPLNVYFFLRRVFREVVPEKMLGPWNNHHILKDLKCLIYCGKCDQMNLGHIMHGLKTSDLWWMKNLGPNSMKLHVLAKIVLWIFQDFFLPIIQTFFCKTETTVYRNRCVFFRKSVWQQLYMKGINDILKTGRVEKIKRSEAERLLKEGNALGLAHLRFIPKTSNLRYVMNLSRESPHMAKNKIPINKQLLNPLQILTYLKKTNPQIVGSACFGARDMFVAWKKYILSLEKDYGKSWPKLYFVKMDISNCFDHIDKDKLFTIIKRTFREFKEDHFLVRKFVAIMKCQGEVRCRFKRVACPLSEHEPDFVNFVRTLQQTEPFRNMVLVDQVKYQHDYIREVLEQIECHLNCNVIKIGKQYFLQKQGICQGSVLSTMLCNIYCADMERTILHLQPEDLLMRMVDDFLFVSPSKTRAVRFLTDMLHGVKAYNFTINTEKVLTNFKYRHHDGSMPPCSFDEWFPWCGMLFDVNKLQVIPDFNGYKNIYLEDSLSFIYSEKPGLMLQKKLKQTLGLVSKRHLLYLDEKINDLGTIISNISKIFMLTAVKFHCFVRRLFRDGNRYLRKDFLCDLFLGLAKYFHAQLSVCSKQEMCLQSSISQDAVFWICINAFVVVLTKYRKYKLLLTQMKLVKKKIEMRLRKKDIHHLLLKHCISHVPSSLQYRRQ